MRNTKIALAVLALVASTAAMADTKVAGCVDASVVRTDKGTVLGGAGDGCASQFGIYSSEDLGNGLTASANLETGFSLNNGTLGNGGSAGNTSAVFNRLANVGVGSKEAKITLGMAKSAWIEAAGGGLTAYGMNGVGVPALAILNPNLSGTTQSGGFFVGNIAGVSGDLGMLNYNAQKSVNAASATADDYTAVRVSSAMSGATVNLGYETRKNAVAATKIDYTNMVLSGSFAVTSEISINGAYSKQNLGGTDTTNKELTAYVLGASYKLSQQFGVGVTYGHNDVTSANVSMTAISAQYDLSKTTALYANFANFKNATVLNNAGNAETAAYSKSLVSVGMQHGF
jgi:predicted porin